jgi:hypothetical protein
MSYVMAKTALIVGLSRRFAMKKLTIGVLIIATGTVFEYLVRRYPTVLASR